MALNKLPLVNTTIAGSILLGNFPVFEAISSFYTLNVFCIFSSCTHLFMPKKLTRKLFVIDIKQSRGDVMVVLRLKYWDGHEGMLWLC